MTDTRLSPYGSVIGRQPLPTNIPQSQIERERRERSEATERAIKARQRRDAERAEQREKQQQEDAVAALEAYRLECEARWVKATGSPEGFSQEWPRLRAQFAGDKQSLVERTREEMRRSGQYSI